MNGAQVALLVLAWMTALVALIWCALLYRSQKKLQQELLVLTHQTLVRDRRHLVDVLKLVEADMRLSLRLAGFHGHEREVRYAQKDLERQYLSVPTREQILYPETGLPGPIPQPGEES